MPEPYPPEFRRRALALLESGRSVRDVAASPAALAEARARVAELENEVKILLNRRGG